jgi:hypothetical protein
VLTVPGQVRCGQLVRPDYALSATGFTGITLPAAFRPATDVYVPVDLCNAKNGRLHITPAGVADVQAPASASLSDAQCFTSLDGATFAP